MRKTPEIWFGPKPKPKKKEKLDWKFDKVNLQLTVLVLDRMLKKIKEKK